VAAVSVVFAGEGNAMMTIEQEKRHGLCVELYHARRALSAVPDDDINGREDVQHRLRRIESELGPIDERVFADFSLALEAAEEAQRERNRELAYRRTGFCK
jgi:hypothetical protein